MTDQMKPKPCKCGGEAKLTGEWMLDFVQCTACGKKGDPFFDGDPSWVVKTWDQRHSVDAKS